MILDVQVWLKASACHKSCLLHQVQALRYPRMLFVQGLALNHDSKPVSRTTQSANQSRQNRQLHGDCSQPHLHPLAMLLGDVRLPEQLYLSCKPIYWIERKLRHPASRTKVSAAQTALLHPFAIKQSSSMVFLCLSLENRLLRRRPTTQTFPIDDLWCWCRKKHQKPLWQSEVCIQSLCSIISY